MATERVQEQARRPRLLFDLHVLVKKYLCKEFYRKYNVWKIWKSVSFPNSLISLNKINNVVKNRSENSKANMQDDMMSYRFGFWLPVLEHDSKFCRYLIPTSQNPVIDIYIDGKHVKLVIHFILLIVNLLKYSNHTPYTLHHFFRSTD